MTTDLEADLEAAEFWPQLSDLLSRKPTADQINDLVDQFTQYKDLIQQHIENDEDLAELWMLANAMRRQ